VSPVRYSRGVKRCAAVPRDASALAESISKADLLELAWDAAALSNDVGADDVPATFDRLVAMLNERREARGAKPLNMSHAALLADREARKARRGERQTASLAEWSEK